MTTNLKQRVDELVEACGYNATDGLGYHNVETIITDLLAINKQMALVLSESKIVNGMYPPDVACKHNSAINAVLQSYHQHGFGE